MHLTSRVVNWPLQQQQKKLLKIDPLSSPSAGLPAEKVLQMQRTPRQVFHSHVSLVTPQHFPNACLVSLNRKGFLEAEIPEDSPFRDEQTAARIFSGALPYPSASSPAGASSTHSSCWSYCYGGHQFGSWAGQLGDGRAMSICQLLVERNPSSNPPTSSSEEGEGEKNSYNTSSSRTEGNSSKVWEFQLKGAGLTPYSRFADGYAVVRSSIREYLCQEAMFALGVPTSRSVALLTSGGEVLREEGPEPGAIICRALPTWIRFGSFEIFYARQDLEGLRGLADYTIVHHFNDILNDEPQNNNNVEGGEEGETVKKGTKYQRLLERVVKDTAIMIARWQACGFCHGVLNTDNMSIISATIDYGPFQMLDAYDPEWICNHSDETGRYSFMQQPSIGLWNLIKLATALSPLLNEEVVEGLEGSKNVSQIVQRIVDNYSPTLRNEYSRLMLNKLGFNVTGGKEASPALRQSLVEPLLILLAKAKMDYSLFFRTLSNTTTTEEQLTEEQWQLWQKCSYAAQTNPQALDKVEEDSETGTSLKTQFHLWFIEWRNCLRQEWRDDHQKLQSSAEYGQEGDSNRIDYMKSYNPKFILRNYIAQHVIDKFQEGGDVEIVNRYLKVLLNPFDEGSLKEVQFFGGDRLVPYSLRDLKCSCSS